MQENTLDKELVRVIINTAQVFGLRVVAEGVEDEATMLELQSMDCDYAQGYFFTKPLPVPEFEQWLRDWQGL